MCDLALYKEICLTYKGWKYKYRCNKEELFEVIPENDKERPKSNSFFKYYALSENSVDAITKCYVYATHPNQFNDSVDCSSQLLDFTSCDNDIIRAVYEPYCKEFLDLYGSIESLKNYTADVFKMLCYGHIGLVSLSKCGTNVALWSYYTDCRGFCVEFDIKRFYFQKHGPFPVHYVDELEKVNVSGNIQVPLLIQTNVKTRDWANEDEWRLLVSNPQGEDFVRFDKNRTPAYVLGGEHDRKMRYPLNAIKSVTLGDAFFCNEKIKQYQVCKNEYEIVFHNVTESLQCRVLDFLIGKKFGAYIAKNKLGVISRVAISIVKLQEGVYRVIYI